LNYKVLQELMKVIIDNKIPYIQGALEPYAEVLYLAGSKTTSDEVRDADAIITRTRTICNEELLAGSKVKFIATATIGFDHIDTAYCHRAGISWTNAPGCNAKSVEQYIAAALFSWALSRREKLHGKTIGIIGVGNVGSKVADFCDKLGMNVLLNDPPRERAEGPQNFTSLEVLQKEADIITFHVPLNMSGEDATFHMAGRKFVENLAKAPLLINSCRGEVFDTESLKWALKNNKIAGFIGDCWENEPNIDRELLDMAFIGTPHIAGYSRDGKANGTQMSIRAVSRFFGLGIDNWQPLQVEMPENTVLLIDGSRRDDESVIAEAILSTYNIEADDENLRKNPLLFEKLREDYPVRREFHIYSVRARNVSDRAAGILTQIGFSLI
jgi:erythronate-4-phosphate dehydrogenase